MAFIYARYNSAVLIGTGENDQIYGAWGNDVIVGGQGNDAIHAGGGNDVVIGGSGADTMWGGAGNDVFMFFSAADMSGDVIRDFSTSEDKLDVRFVTQNLGAEFIDREDFSGVGEAEVRHFYTADRMGGYDTVQFDLDGDGASDASLQLRNAYHLEASDFLF